ncbi:MAG: hypothetical protein ACXQTS_04585 [Candidatus Methanospirareceae archaeon]
MKYIAKLRVRKDKLSDEIREYFKEEFGMHIDITKGKGEVFLPGIDTTILGFTARDEYGTVAPIIAEGYETAEWVAYRIYADIQPYCPGCKEGKDVSIWTKYCAICGERLQFRF